MDWDDISLTAVEAGVLHQRLVGTPRPSRMTYEAWSALADRLERLVTGLDPAPAECSQTCAWCNRYPTIAHYVQESA